MVNGDEHRYTFAQLTETTQGFVNAVGIGRFAPIRFSLATIHTRTVPLSSS